MSGESAAELINQAEGVGISDFRLLLLKGQSRLYAGEPGTAIGFLEEAVDLVLDSVRANSTLALAYYHGGRLMDGVVQREKAAGLEDRVENARDLLFLAHAKFFESEDALDHIEQHFKFENSPVALLVRADMAVRELRPVPELRTGTPQTLKH
jgi:hypothetical protein